MVTRRSVQKTGKKKEKQKKKKFKEKMRRAKIQKKEPVMRTPRKKRTSGNAPWEARECSLQKKGTSARGAAAEKKDDK